MTENSTSGGILENRRANFANQKTNGKQFDSLLAGVLAK